MTSLEDDVEALEIGLLLEGINARYGYDLRGYSAASMRRRVLAALAKSRSSSLGELQTRVLRDPAFFAEVIEDLTVQVSEMFRDPDFYRVFRARVVPILRTYPLLKIWHAGCATAEEVYSSAILLTEEGLYDRAQIYATDLSPRALEQAANAIYSADRLPAFEAGYLAAGGRATLSKYYTKAYGLIELSESLRSNISFFQHDLVSDHVFGEMHVVFCRNVLIYFGTSLRDRVLAKLSGALRPGGFLCLGSSESLVRCHPERQFEEFAGEERIYRHEA